MHRQTVKGKIDGKITAGKLPKAHRWNRPLTPPRSGLVQRRFSWIDVRLVRWRIQFDLSVNASIVSQKFIYIAVPLAEFKSPFIPLFQRGNISEKT